MGLTATRSISRAISLGLLAVVALFAALASSASPSAAQGSGEFVSRAKRAILMDAESGAVLYQLNADELAPPASMSKLMTLEVLFQAMKQGRVKPEDEF